MSQELRSFVQEALARGIGRDQIRDALRQAGWPADEVEPALAAWSEAPFPIPVPQRRPYLSAREAFLYLVMFVTLYTATFNVGVILFEAIERWVPDPARRGFGGSMFSPQGVRNAVAAIVIAFPIFLVLSRHIGNSLRREPEKRASRIRKWLTYLTLFVAALVIIGDLTFLVSRLLSGELPPRFLLKTLAVLLIAGTVFTHYLADLRRDERPAPALSPGTVSPLARVAGACVFASIVLGLVLAGSPRAERSRQIDAQRVSDLQAIALAIDEHHHARRSLPESLGVVATQPHARLSINDPATGAAYEYRTLDSLRYELCATFDRESDTRLEASLPYEREPRFWRHGPGHACFTLEVARRVAEPVAVPSRP